MYNALEYELAGLESNQGIYGYVHHQGFQDPGALTAGTAFDAKGNLIHPWFEEVPGTRKQRGQGLGYVENLMTADISRRRKEIKADARNAWMATMEDDYGLPVEAFEPGKDENGNLIPAPDLPKGYSRRASVVGNFGRFANRKIYLPEKVYDLYRMAVEKSTIDPELRDISESLNTINNAISLVNEAMLYHPAKFMRDLFSVPFHVMEFARDWAIKNPGDITSLPGIMLDAARGAFDPKVWQRLPPESYGEYSEAVNLQVDDDSHWITRGLDRLGGQGMPIGSTMAALLRQVNLASAGDLPVKRFFTLVGEKLADKRKLTGLERERFVRDLWNTYAFDTADLPPVMAIARGHGTAQYSKVLGAVTRGVFPFFGYATRLAQQMVINPFIVKGPANLVGGLAGMWKREKGAGKRALFGFAELSRPFMWVAAAMLIRAGAGGLLPPEEEEGAGKFRNKANLDGGLRTATRQLVKQDDQGEYYASLKGLGQYAIADSMLQVWRGNQKMGDFTRELTSVHPVAQFALSMVGLEDAYSANQPTSAQLGELVATMMAPQFARIGPDLAKFIRMAMGDNSIPDTSKDGFLSAFFRQLGAPTGEAKYARGKIVVSQPIYEWLKLGGVNVKFIPWDMIQEEVERDAGGLKHLTDLSDALAAPEPWKNLKDKKGKPLPPMTEQEFLYKKGLTGRGSTVAQAKAKVAEELDEKSRRVREIADVLRKRGREVELPEAGKKKAKNGGSDLSAQDREMLRKALLGLKPN